jgi:hypothetical protein
MESNGSRLKKHDTTLYDKIKNDKDGEEKKKIKTELETNKKLQNSNKEKLAKFKKQIEDGEEEDNKANQKKVKELEDVIVKKENEIQIAESVDKKL